MAGALGTASRRNHDASVQRVGSKTEWSHSLPLHNNKQVLQVGLKRTRKTAAALLKVLPLN
jgi:hypothetical protein